MNVMAGMCMSDIVNSLLQRDYHSRMHMKEIKKTPYVTLKCAFCGIEFNRETRAVKSKLKLGQKYFYCCKSCSSSDYGQKSLGRYYTKRKKHPRCKEFTTLTCSYCGKEFKRESRIVRAKIKKGQTDFFCSRECMAMHWSETRSE